MDEDKSQLKAKKWSHLVKVLSSTLRHRKRPKTHLLIGQSSRILCSSVSVLGPDVGDTDDEDQKSLYSYSDLSGVGIENGDDVETIETIRSDHVHREGNDVMEVQLTRALPFAFYGTDADQLTAANPDVDDHEGRDIDQMDDTGKDQSVVDDQTDRHCPDLRHEADNGVQRCPVNHDLSDPITSLQTSLSEQTDVFRYQGAICLQTGTNQSVTCDRVVTVKADGSDEHEGMLAIEREVLPPAERSVTNQSPQEETGLSSDRARLQSARLIILTAGVVLLTCVIVGVGVDLWTTRCWNTSGGGCYLVNGLNSKVMTSICLGATLVYTVSLAGWLLFRSGGVYGPYFAFETTSERGRRATPGGGESIFFSFGPTHTRALWLRF